MSEEVSPWQSVSDKPHTGRTALQLRNTNRAESGSWLRPPLWQSIPLPFALSRPSAISSPPQTPRAGSHPLRSLNTPRHPRHPLRAPLAPSPEPHRAYCGRTEGAPDLWKWTICHLPSRRCQMRVSSDWAVRGIPPASTYCVMRM